MQSKSKELGRGRILLKDWASARIKTGRHFGIVFCLFLFFILLSACFAFAFWKLLEISGSNILPTNQTGQSRNGAWLPPVQTASESSTGNGWNSTIGRPHHPQDLPLVRYFHPPKTGSGFFNVLVYTLCHNIATGPGQFLMGHEQNIRFKSLAAFRKEYPPEKHCDGTMYLPSRLGHPPFNGWAGPFSHQPAYPHDAVYYGTYAGLFRDPTERVMSAYYYNRHLFGGAAPRKDLFSLSVAEWVRHPGVAGCQTKMLIGRNCGADYNVTQQDVEGALDMLRTKFLFVGLTAHFAESVELWHNTIVGGRAQPFEFQNTRPGKYPDTPSDTKGELLNRGYPGESWTDWADEQVFREAKRIFRHRCRIFRHRCRIAGIAISPARHGAKV